MSTSDVQPHSSTSAQTKTRGVFAALNARLRGLSRRNYLPRVVGFTLLGLMGLQRWSSTGKQQESLLVASVLVMFWAHVALALAIRSESSKTVELRNVYGDSMIGGIFLVLTGGSLWIAQSVLIVLCANNMAIGGVRTFLRGLLAIVVGVVLALVTFGFVFQPDPNSLVAIGAVFALFCYSVATNYVTYSQAKSLIAARRKSDAQNEEIRRQQEILSEQSQEIELNNAMLQEKNLEVQAAHRQSETILLNILPSLIATRLIAGEQLIAERFEHVTVLFADIAGFTEFSSLVPPEELVGLLDTIFSAFDTIADAHHCEKIKTIGDCYMLVGGLPEPDTPEQIAARASHPERITSAALAMLEAIERLNAALGLTLAIRIGIHTGAVVAGVIGRKKFAYDLWGDTVNTASRMETQGVAGKIHCTEELMNTLLRQQNGREESAHSPRYAFEKRSTIQVKGKGTMQTYFVQMQKTEKTEKSE
jgi:class 3 adenylate cyclase